MSPKLKKTSDRNLYLEDPSGIYIWRERIRGRNHWRSTGERTLSAARQKVKDFRLEATHEKTREVVRHTFDEAFALLLEISKGNARRTEASIRTQLGHLRPWFLGKPEDERGPARPSHCVYLDQFERDYPEVWSAYKQDQHRLTPNRKLGHDRRILLQVLKAAHGKGWLKREFKNRDLPLLESSDPVGRIIENAELERMIPYIRQNPKLELQVKLALFMGMRKREILHLKVAEVELKRGVINLKGRRVKTRRGREVPIHDEVVADLRKWVQDAQGDYLFPATYSGGYAALNQCQDDNSGAWQRVKRLAKVRCRFHDLRHTAISKMIQAGMPNATISMVTGASEKVIRAVYAHISKEGMQMAKKFNVGISWGEEKI